MARATRKAPSLPFNGLDTTTAPPWNPAASPGLPVDAARALLTHPLGLVQDVMHALLRLQAQQQRALLAWTRTVDDAVHEAGAAQDLPGMLSVLLNLAGRQFSLASAEGASGWAQWLEGEMQVADRLRSEAITLVQDLQPREAAAAEREDVSAMLAAWAHMQDQWRTAMQRLIEAAAQSAAAARSR